MQSTSRKGLQAFNSLGRAAHAACRTPQVASAPLYGHRQLSRTTRALQSRNSSNPFDVAYANNTSRADLTGAIAGMNNLKGDIKPPPHETSNLLTNVITGRYNQRGLTKTGNEKAPEPHHLHIVCSKHNTHITLTAPNRDPKISVATGNLGFRKQHRSTFDAAYQLGAWVLGQIQERGLLVEIRELELVFRGFGEGREAVRKVIMGSEGISIRPKIIKVSDATKLKFGGTRSKKPRRLG